MKNKKFILIISSVIILLFSISLVTCVVKINEKTKTPKIDAQVLKAQNLLVEYYKIEKKNLNYIGTSKDFHIFINKTNNIKYKVSLKNDMIVPVYDTNITSSSSSGGKKK